MTRHLSYAMALAACTAAAQAPPLHPLPCPAPASSAFDFILGRWEGTLFEMKGNDSTFEGITVVATTSKILNGCALEEQWHFQDHGAPESDVVILRAFDVPSQRWRYSGYTNLNEFFTYDGQLDGAIWRFHLTRTIDGKPVRIRISWVQTPWGYSEQIARSTDQGATWVNTRHINYQKRET